MSGAQHLSAELAGDQSKPLLMHAKWVWGLEDERQSLIPSPSKLPGCCLHAPTAGLSATSQSRVRGESGLMVLVIFQIHWQQNQLQDHSPKASTKTSKTPQPEPLPKCRKWLEEGNICTRALPSKSADSIPCMEKRGMRKCGFKPVPNPRPGTHSGSEAAPDSSTPTNVPLWLSAEQLATSLSCGATLVTFFKHC